jgi:dihydroxy-acid dehydratase
MSQTKGLGRNLTNYGDPDFSWFLRRALASSLGYSKQMLARPVIGVATSGGDFNNCHRLMPDLLNAVKRGVIASGGLPLEFPTISLGEVFLDPTSMMFRNLMAIDVEEMIRSQPMDAVILIGGCDKTVPAQLMGAASAGIPAIQLVTGPMITDRVHGERVGACTDCRRFWARFRAGDIDADQLAEIGEKLATTAGTCPMMGTASTMACVAETLGASLPGTATIPAVHADRLRAAERTGAEAVRLSTVGTTLRDVITPGSVENALRVLLAIGGSTNALIHLTAIAGRLGIPVSLNRINELSATTPVLVNLKPIGRFYMEDLHAAGGLGAVLRELAPLLDLECRDVTGTTLRERLSQPSSFVDRDVIRTLDNPFDEQGGLIALFGSLCPGGAILKRAAADRSLFEHQSRAVVFEGLEDLSARIDQPDLDVRADDILVLTNAGPVAAGMPEAGYLPIPVKLARAGVKDMVRISDARMSGSAFGTIILHVTPESAMGGPLALVKTGDQIRLSVNERRLDLLVDNAELSRRRALFKTHSFPRRGWAGLYARAVQQADRGCDFDFLTQAGGFQLRPDIQD